LTEIEHNKKVDGWMYGHVVRLEATHFYGWLTVIKNLHKDKTV
jgi:hypothetical protein